MSALDELFSPLGLAFGVFLVVALAIDLCGGNPKNENGSCGKPHTDSAVKGALAPGIGSTLICFSTHARTNSRPGSEIPGVPASETRAMLRPLSSEARSCGNRARELCWW